MSGIYTPLIGRFGNACFQYCYARALAEREGKELVTPDWWGHAIFQIERTRPKRDDDVMLGGYCQNQESLIYTRKQVKEWLRFRPEIGMFLSALSGKMLAHRRVGDYEGYGMVVVSKASYLKAAIQCGYDSHQLEFVTEEKPLRITSDLPDFLPDFYRMAKADVLFRGNSSFSWWAATLSNAEVYSPVIDGMEGGREHECRFVHGNHPKFCNLDGITDLHLPKK